MRSARPFALLAALLAALLVWPTVAGAAPAITIARSQTPGETGFTARLTGFEPGEAIALQLAASGTPPLALDLPPITILVDGTYTLSILSTGLTGGEYTLTARRGASIVASATFSVAIRATPTRPPIVATPTRAMPTPPPTGDGGYLPGLPNTGGGGAHSTPIVPGIPLLAFAAGGVFLIWRGRARRLTAAQAKIRAGQNERHDGR